MDASSSRRPGSDLLQPHADLHLPEVNGLGSTSSSPSLHRSSSPAMSQYSSDLQADMTPRHMARTPQWQSLLRQVASLHRAAQVARHNWLDAHRHELACVEQTTSAAGTDAGSTDGRSERIQSLLDRVNSLRDSLGADLETRQLALRVLEAAQQLPAPQHSEPLWSSRRRRTFTSCSVNESLDSWNQLCFHLACAAGIAADDDEASGFSSLDASASANPPPFLFHRTPELRRLPDPSWARRFGGPAGIWLQGELTRRRERGVQATFGSAEGSMGNYATPASAIANEWRRTSTRGHRRAQELGSGSRSALAEGPNLAASPDRSIAFPSLDPRSRLGAIASTSSAVGEIPTATVAADDTTSFALPASTSVAVGATDTAWQSGPRRERDATGAGPSGDDYTIRAGSAGSTISTRPFRLPVIRNENEVLPESGFQVPPASTRQRADAADEVTRLAERARQQRATNRPNASADQSTDRPAARNSGMDYLRRLRELDGLYDPSAAPSGREAEPTSQRDDSSPPPRHSVFPWHVPPRLVEPSDPAPGSSHPRLRLGPRSTLTNHPDPDGDAVGSDWYRGVRARQRQAAEEAQGQQGQRDPNGESAAGDEAQAPTPGGEEAPREVPWPWTSRRSHLRAHETNSENAGAARRQRNRSALVVDDGAVPTLGVSGVEGWTLIAPASPTTYDGGHHSDSSDHEDSMNVTMWFRGPAHTAPTISTSPGPLERGSAPELPASVTPGSENQTRSGGDDLRTLRRPQRLSSLGNEEIETARSTFFDIGERHRSSDTNAMDLDPARSRTSSQLLDSSERSVFALNPGLAPSEVGHSSTTRRTSSAEMSAPGNCEFPHNVEQEQHQGDHKEEAQIGRPDIDDSLAFISESDKAQLRPEEIKRLAEWDEKVACRAIREAYSRFVSSWTPEQEPLPSMDTSLQVHGLHFQRCENFFDEESGMHDGSAIGPAALSSLTTFALSCSLNSSSLFAALCEGRDRSIFGMRFLMASPSHVRPLMDGGSNDKDTDGDSGLYDPRTTAAEDRAWSTARRHIIQRRRHEYTGESHVDGMRRSLGLPTRSSNARSPTSANEAASLDVVAARQNTGDEPMIRDRDSVPITRLSFLEDQLTDLLDAFHLAAGSFGGREEDDEFEWHLMLDKVPKVPESRRAIAETPTPRIRRMVYGCLPESVALSSGDIAALRGGLDSAEMSEDVSDGPLDQRLASRAKAITTHISEHIRLPGCREPLGPSFILHSVEITSNVAPPIVPTSQRFGASASGSGDDKHHQTNVRYLLVFLSERPVMADDMDPWDSYDIVSMKELATTGAIKGLSFHTNEAPSTNTDGPGRADRPGDQDMDAEDDIGDPDVMLNLQTGSNSVPSHFKDSLPRMRPLMMLELRAQSQHKDPQVFSLPHDVHSHARGACGRYLAFKLLRGTFRQDGQPTEADETTVLHLGIKAFGWPASGTTSASAAELF